MSWSDPNQKANDEAAKTTKDRATHKCICKAIKPKWLSTSRCQYCKPVKR